MENKRFLKKFENQSVYESQKDEVMGMPHVVLLNDTKKVVYASENKEDEIDYASQPFTLVALEDGTMDIAMPSGATFMNYSLNDGDWVENTEDIVLEVKANDKVKLKGNADAVLGDSYKIFDLSMPFNAEGNIMSLLYGDDFQDKKTIERGSCFFYCFFDTNIVSAKNLILPATTLASNCYHDMFCDCTSLVEAPQLPATNLANYCYYFMFKGCTSLTTAPELPATILAYQCYSYMFQDCTSLTEAPELPATTLVDWCYSGMFFNCTSLTTTPSVLPATTLADYCYAYMFQDCTSLTTTPQLQATTLADYCYAYMFKDCTSLVEAPELPAITLKTECYAHMFYGCASLTTAPELPATTLADWCYSGMFKDCSKLNKITMLATYIGANKCINNWVDGVASSGTFIKNAAMTSLPSGSSGIPEGWTVQNY